MSPWEVYDLIDFFKEKSQEWSAKHEIRKQKRFVKREENALAEQNVKKKLKKAEEERLAQLTVDQETGEILDDPDDNEASIFDIGLQPKMLQLNLKFWLMSMYQKVWKKQLLKKILNQK